MPSISSLLGFALISLGLVLQRYLMGTVLAGLAMRMAFEARKA
jgi:hypothetical protein